MPPTKTMAPIQKSEINKEPVTQTDFKSSNTPVINKESTYKKEQEIPSHKVKVTI